MNNSPRLAARLLWLALAIVPSLLAPQAAWAQAGGQNSLFSAPSTTGLLAPGPAARGETFGAPGVLVVDVYHLSLNAGERLTTAGTASVVVAAAPGMTLAMALMIGQERFSRRRAAGLALSFAGVIVVILLGSGERISFAHAHGPLLVLAAPISFAAYNVLVKPLLARHGAVAVTAAASLVGTVGLMPFGGAAAARR